MVMTVVLLIHWSMGNSMPLAPMQNTINVPRRIKPRAASSVSAGMRASTA
jgi:hypothetical protein